VVNNLRHDAGIVPAVVRIPIVFGHRRAAVGTQIDLNPPVLGMRAAILEREELVALWADHITNGFFFNVCTVVTESVDREEGAAVAARDAVAGRHGDVGRDADEEGCSEGGRRRHVACSRESSR